MTVVNYSELAWNDPDFHLTEEEIYNRDHGHPYLGLNESPTIWVDGVEYNRDDGLPTHLLMPVDRRGHGPLCDDAPHCGCCDPISKWVCWCGDKSCPGPEGRDR